MGKLPLAALACVLPHLALAANVSVVAMSQMRTPISDAVIMLTPVDAPLPGVESSRRAVMVQEHQQFSPFVLPVRVGTTVEFPNRDAFRHHVYSFSNAKTFELKLYGGGETQTVEFDAPGPVALGCNIHDNMLAYVYVVETPYFGKTLQNGRTEIAEVPNGRYTISVWHPNQRRGSPESAGQIEVSDGDKAETMVEVEMKRDRRPRQPGAFDEQDY